MLGRESAGTLARATCRAGFLTLRNDATDRKVFGSDELECTPSLKLLTSDRGRKVVDLLQIVSHLPRLCPGSYSQAQEEQKNEKSVLMN